MTKLSVKDVLGDWLLSGDIPGGHIDILFNSYQNAVLVKDVLEWEANHPNQGIPYVVQRQA